MGGQRLSSAAAAILRGIGPTPHHFGGPESTQKRLLGLQGKRAGQGLPHPPILRMPYLATLSVGSTV